MIIDKDLLADGNMSYTIVTPPTVEPVTVEELKTFARIDSTDEDALLANFIITARAATEKYLGRALIYKTIKAVMDYWPCNKIELPLPPLSSITSVQIRDENDTLTTYDSSNYYVVKDSIPGSIVIKYGNDLPENYSLREVGAFIITYVAGYGDSPDDVPEPIRQAVLQWATNIYETRAVGDDPPPETKMLLDLFRVERLD